MTCSAGADWVTAVEISGHMADAAAQALVANGFAGRSSVIARDVRRVHADAQPGGRPADLEARADLVIFEVGPLPPAWRLPVAWSWAGVLGVRRRSSA